MDRQIVYPGSIPLDTDLLSVQRNIMNAVGYLAQATLGQNSAADGLKCLPTVPPSLAVSVGPGTLAQLETVDSNSFGSLPAMPNAPLMKMGINIGATNFLLTAPTISGQTITYLIQAAILEVDSSPVTLPYYNAANPSQPYSGPANTGAAQNTQRLQLVELLLKPGPATAVGPPNIPAVDVGWVGLYLVTVFYGQTSVSASNISTLSSAPFVNWKLPQLTPGTRNLAVFQPASQGSWSAPPGASVLRVTLWAGGGAGGSGFGGAGGGGAGGGFSEGFYPVTPGQNFLISVGNGGSGAGSAGGGSSFGSLASATGGQGGGNGSANAGGLAASLFGSGFGSGLGLPGGGGGDPFSAGAAWMSGAGGSAHMSGGGLGVVGVSSGSTSGKPAGGPGAGGSGGVGNGVGGQGGPGLVMVEW